MKIGILGSGVVARSLGDGFLAHGYEVKLGTQHAEKLHEWVQSTSGKGSVGSFDEAATFGELLVFGSEGQVFH